MVPLNLMFSSLVLPEVKIAPNSSSVSRPSSSCAEARGARQVVIRSREQAMLRGEEICIQGPFAFGWGNGIGHFTSPVREWLMRQKQKRGGSSLPPLFCIGGICAGTADAYFTCRLERSPIHGYPELTAPWGLQTGFETALLRQTLCFLVEQV